jgi:poly-gamma-glutamate synthesis protein (capsule biosynthesis protein)
LYVPTNTDDITLTAIAGALGLDKSKLSKLTGDVKDIEDSSVAFIPSDDLTTDLKLLTFDYKYYLDSFNSGAVFRQAEFSGESATSLQDLKLNNLASKDSVLKVNMTGVTALTRVMMTKFASVKDPLYFSELIGDYVADADITHVSNEVSFKPGCQISYTVFCSPPEMIEVLKDSGVDMVELTGNHNNDTGNQYNTDTINLYKSLGWQTIGGGLNNAEAAKFYTADQKGSKVSFLAYNYPDSPNGNAISGPTTAGANSFDFDRITTDIESAKKQSDFIVVNVQFWECYAYPDGFVEFPECDGPIADQKEVFRKLVDLGADMVVGSSAHQPQTYELYNGKPIYYGLGNLYFDQTQWPGTERGIILTHYFSGGKLMQTKLAPTVYDTDLQTHMMTNDQTQIFLERLRVARINSGL